MKPVVIDVSHHNTVQDWSKVKDAGIQGIIHKCTQGISYVDGTYVQRRGPACAQGLLWGAYHFATGDDPVAQADYFLAHANPDSSTLLALDWEDNTTGRTMSAEQARAFLGRLMQKTGRQPSGIVVYGGNVPKELIKTDDDAQFFAQFPLWLCEYGPLAKVPRGWKSYWLWQYTETGQIDGMAADGRVDLNYHGGADLRREWAPNVPSLVVDQPMVVSSRDDSDSDTVKQSPAKVAFTSPSIWAAMMAPFFALMDGVKHVALYMKAAVLMVLGQPERFSSEVSNIVSPTLNLLDTLQIRSKEIGIAIALAAAFLYVVRHYDELTGNHNHV